MTRQDKLEQIRRKLFVAHAEIVAAAAALQSRGADTSPLSQPVVRITDALAELDRVMNLEQSRQREQVQAGE